MYSCSCPSEKRTADAIVDAIQALVARQGHIRLSCCAWIKVAVSGHWSNCRAAVVLFLGFALLLLSQHIWDMYSTVQSSSRGAP
jgi:hypothetical protein